MLHYVVCWTEIDGIYSCGDEHLTIKDALGCMVPDGRTFMRARDQGMLRSLNDAKRRRFAPSCAPISYDSGHFSASPRLRGEKQCSLFARFFHLTGRKTN
jgi:hypothetical protein